MEFIMLVMIGLHHLITINVRVNKFSTQKSNFFVCAQTISIEIWFSYEYIMF